MKSTLSIACLTFLALCLAAPQTALGQKKDLSVIEKSLHKSRAKELELSQSVKENKKRLKDLRRNMVEQTASLQKEEKRLLDLNDRLEKIAQEIEENKAALEEDQKNMGDLVLALQRLSRVPPEVLIARPDAPINTARSSMLVRTALPSLQKQAAELEERLETLDALQVELHDKRQKAETTRIALKKEQDNLEALLKKRQNMYDHTLGDRRAQERETARLKIKARDISGLITALKEQTPTPESKPDKPFSFFGLFDGDGGDSTLVLPVAGKIATRYGEKDNHGMTSKGLTIRSTPGAVVVSPLPGKVRFSGPFKNYKLILIIEHDDGYHSLIAGLSEIYAATGAEVFPGEPVGKVASSNNQHTSLYFELRHNGKPTNPSTKLRKG